MMDMEDEELEMGEGEESAAMDSILQHLGESLKAMRRKRLGRPQAVEVAKVTVDGSEDGELPGVEESTSDETAIGEDELMQLLEQVG